MKAEKKATTKVKADKKDSQLKAAYKTLLAELKTATDAKKAAKAELQKKVTELYAEYRKYVKTTYAEARKAAVDKFKAVQKSMKDARAERKADAEAKKAEKAEKVGTKACSTSRWSLSPSLTYSRVYALTNLWCTLASRSARVT